MSALAGLFKFDPKERIAKNEISALAAGIDRIGPDGGSECIHSNLGMVYRAFHTTPESYFETQPLVTEDCILTWDGRLDNRDEIRARLDRTFEDTPTDADLVLAAYVEFGSNCFSELLGDWALAIWDPKKQHLILARDYIGVRRLFYRVDDMGIAWCTIIEPLVLTAPGKLHPDLDYLAGCFYPRPPVDTTPYQEIRPVVPGSILTVQKDGKRVTHCYWFLNPHARIQYATDREYEEHFRHVFMEAVSRRLRADRTILAELSGGADSSSIVCMADRIQRQYSRMPIQTLSYYSVEEPGGDERPYFTLVEQQRGLTGHHVSISELCRQTLADMLTPLPVEYFSARPGYFKQSLRWDSTLQEIQERAGARVILSGLGGDEVLGGIQYEAPELADYLSTGKFFCFAKSIFQWSLTRKKTVFQLLGDTLQLISASRNPIALLASDNHSLSWSRLSRPLHSALPSFAQWRNLLPHKVVMESVRYSLASQLTCTDPPLVGLSEMRYPLLDRSLFVFLASIPRNQVVQPGRRRHLMRRALRGIVPDAVLFRKTKWFGSRSVLAELSAQEGTLAALFNDTWLSEANIINKEMLRARLDATQHGGPQEGTQMLLAIGIEQWLRAGAVSARMDLSLRQS